MNPILVVSEDSSLATSLVAIGLSLGDSVHAVVFSEKDVQVLANLPVRSVIWLQGTSTRPEDYADALAELIHREMARLVLVGDTIRGRELAAKTADILQAGFISSASSIRLVDGTFEASRLTYGGAVISTHTITERCIVTMSPGNLEDMPLGQGTAPVELLKVDTDERVTVIETMPIGQADFELSAARVVVGVGLGFNAAEDLTLARVLARRLHGTLACTRPVAEEKGWLPVECYVGISGAKIKPELYIAAGISGQVQHMVGIRDAKCIVAINKNKEAPIFRSADYGIVGDLYEVLPLLIEAIGKR